MVTYLILMGISLLGPLLLSFDKKVAYFRWWPALFWGIFLNGLIFISWDIWFTRNGIWSFNSDYLVGLNLINLPIEEWSFFVIVPFASVFIYACIKAYFSDKGIQPYVSIFNYAFIILCVFAIALFHTKTYTLVNCSLALILLLLQQFWIKGKYMGYFWLAYLVHLIPFLLVNGVLTGAFTKEPIVIYDAQNIIGWHIITIPVEDTIYALSCLMIPVTVIEYVRRLKN